METIPSITSTGAEKTSSSSSSNSFQHYPQRHPYAPLEHQQHPHNAQRGSYAQLQQQRQQHVASPSLSSSAPMAAHDHINRKIAKQNPQRCRREGDCVVNPSRSERYKDSRRNLFTWEEIEKHTTPGNCWLVVRNKVYDVTCAVAKHPGGVKTVLKYSGTDATEHFDFHAGATQDLWKRLIIGRVYGTPEDSTCCIL